LKGNNDSIKNGSKYRQTILNVTKYVRLLDVEIFKSFNHTNPEFMWNSFALRENLYNLRQGYKLLIPSAKTTRVNYFDFRAALAWNVKAEKNLSKFRYSKRTYNLQLM